ncbi:hypothetical protein PHYSODRAFT_301339 [Phytophthora sojae]|uniref:Uncharacterized protein n=1 Tax=Phytophthora sojae (strain P6497) TaxID=1094619 RepID=G4ZJJ1_PHYSP|nr:hypothetical protein PHYSODRAFT_301339 [Phytophthora sojae]EGZ18856.1 hypothetical protein PHYSODRAFT_301339 [Phytophthora sojae]|eukprot:XP_009527914.1 hypothetical protein PHYSODRAFT_301339 [Phytophthora sojae]
MANEDQRARDWSGSTSASRNTAKYYKHNRREEVGEEAEEPQHYDARSPARIVNHASEHAWWFQGGCWFPSEAYDGDVIAGRSSCQGQERSHEQTTRRRWKHEEEEPQKLDKPVKAIVEEAATRAVAQIIVELRTNALLGMRLTAMAEEAAKRAVARHFVDLRAKALLDSQGNTAELCSDEPREKQADADGLKKKQGLLAWREILKHKNIKVRNVQCVNGKVRVQFYRSYWAAGDRGPTTTRPPLRSKVLETELQQEHYSGDYDGEPVCPTKWVGLQS